MNDLRLLINTRAGSPISLSMRSAHQDLLSHYSGLSLYSYQYLEAGEGIGHLTFC